MKYLYTALIAFIVTGVKAQTSYIYYDTLEVGCGNVRLIAPPVILDNEGINSDIYTISTIPYLADTLTTFTQVDPDNPSFYSIALGFNFYFFNELKKYIRVYENNFIAFNGHSGTTWPVQPVDTNSTNFSLPPRNSIMAPWTILEPYSTIWGSGHGTIRYGAKGSAPFRRYIIEFNELGTICSNDYFSGRTIIYESTNVVETHIRHKPLCNQSGSDLALHGLLGSNLFKSAIVPGRNATEWTADYEGTRFTPYDTLYILNSVNWYNDQNQPITTNDTLSQPIGLSNDYKYVAEYINIYGGDTITVTKMYHLIIDTGNLQIATNNLTYTNGTVTTCGQGDIYLSGKDWYGWYIDNNLMSNTDTFSIGAISGQIYLLANTNNCQDSIPFNIINQAEIDTFQLFTCPNQYDTLINTIPGAYWANMNGNTYNWGDTLIYHVNVSDLYNSNWYLALPDGQCVNYYVYDIVADSITNLQIHTLLGGTALYAGYEGMYLNWYHNGVLIDQHDFMIDYPLPGTYYAEYTSPNGCGTLTSQSVIWTGINENKYSFTVYPNPATDFITIDMQNFAGKVYDVAFINIQGQQVLSMAYTGNQLSTETLPNGAYLLKLNTSSGVLSKIIVVEK